MARRKSLVKATDREKKWVKVFNALVKTCRSLQDERDFLRREVINQMKMESKFDSTKAELLLCFKERDAVLYKHRYDNAKDELSDLKKWLNYVSQKFLQSQSTSVDVGNKGPGSQIKALQDEIRKLKSESEEYKSAKNFEVSSLLAEKNFIWNQFHTMESNLTEKLQKKSEEVEHANEKVRLLVSRAEQLELSNEKLRTDLTKMETESGQKSEEICRLLKENELLKSKLSSTTPLLGSRGAEATLHSKGGRNSASNRRVISVKKESGALDTVKKKTRKTRQSAHKSTRGKTAMKLSVIKGNSSPSRPLEVINIPDTPKLFSSSFKVPKLKHSSSRRIV